MLFINANIHTMEDNDIADGFFRVKDGRFSEIGKMNQLKIEKSEKIIDLMGKNVYPGFIDAHSHIGMWEDGLGFEGDDGNEDTDPITPHLRALDAINPFDHCFEEALDYAVTTVITGPGSANPIGGQLLAMKTAGSRIEDMVVCEPLAMKMALGENPKTVHNGKSQSPITRMATTAMIRENLYKAKKYLEEKQLAMEDEEQSEPEFDLKFESLALVLQKKIPVHFHAHRRDDILTAIRIAKEFDIDYVIVHATEGHMIAQILAEENTKVLAGPLLCDRSKPELKNLTPSLPYHLSENGVKFSIITDHPVIPQQYITVCAGLAIREGLSVDEAIKSITIYPAQICNIDDRVGSIRVGKDADFAVYTGNPLDLQSKPEMVYLNAEKMR